MKPNAKYLISPIFVLSLVILICNDLWWKYTFSNVLTGKLSDFSGVIVLGLLFNFISDKNRRLNALFVIVFFTFWKSPLSESLIFAWNELDLMTIARVVDYSDLLAFLALPIVTHVQFRERESLKHPIFLYSTLALSTFALTATSRVQRMHSPYWANGVEQKVVRFTTKLSKDEFITKMDENLGIKLWKEDTVWLDGGRFTSFSFVDNSTYSGHVIDTCILTMQQFNKRKLAVTLLSVKLKEDAEALNLYNMKYWKEAFEVRNIYQDTQRVYYGGMPPRIRDEN